MKFTSSTPIVLSAEAAECGLACLTMVARHWGHEVDLTALRLRFPMSLAGVTLRDIVGMANELGLSSRALRAEPEALGSIELPAIVHWNLSHFVVLVSVGRNVVIHDPAYGARSMTLQEFSQGFTGVVLELSPAVDFKPIEQKSRVALRSLFANLKGIWGAIAKIMVLSVTSQALLIALPFQIQIIVDQAIARSEASLVVVVALTFLAIAILQVAADGLRNWTLQAVGLLASYQVAGNVIRHLLRLPTGFFERRHIGDILSRISSVRSLQQIITAGLLSSVIDGLIAAFAICVLLKYSPPIASFCVLAALLSITLSLISYPFIRAKTEQGLTEGSREQSYLMESIRAITTVRLFGWEAQRESQWRSQYLKATRATLEATRLDILSGSGQRIISLVQAAAVIVIASNSVIAGRFSLGMLFVCVTFSATFTDKSLALVTQFSKLRLVGLHMDRISDLVATPAEDQTGGTLSNRGVEALRFDAVYFRYGRADQMVLQNLSFQVEPGAYIAIVGASGAGKSTFLKLLTGLVEPSYGSIYLGDAQAQTQHWRRWRSRAGIVTQADVLLSGTIADNISFFDPEATLDKIEAAAKLACIHDDIALRPMRYLSLIGDMGSSLSAGQRQRVLLARAFYRNPDYLILDEGTANLDEAMEAKIAENVLAMNCTRIIVSHRPALVERATSVFELSDGKLTRMR